MSNEDFSILVVLVSCAVSIWLIVLFLRLCNHVRAIKGLLLTAYDLEEYKGYSGVAFRKRGPSPDKEPVRVPSLLG